jgi:hypothetical protein
VVVEKILTHFNNNGAPSLARRSLPRLTGWLDVRDRSFRLLLCNAYPNAAGTGEAFKSMKLSRRIPNGSRTAIKAPERGVSTIQVEDAFGPRFVQRLEQRVIQLTDQGNHPFLYRLRNKMQNLG